MGNLFLQNLMLLVFLLMVMLAAGLSTVALCVKVFLLFLAPFGVLPKLRK